MAAGLPWRKSPFRFPDFSGLYRSKVRNMTSRTWMPTAAVAAVAGILLLSGSSASAPMLAGDATAKLAPGARALLRSEEPVHVIVQLREPVGAGDFAAMRRAGASVTRRYQSLPMAA